ncbi:hypothetical protein FFI94_018960 [Rhodococcus sp. KBS0724]|uniref:hypothetical protein n=1 Tax=Rhodococcus sp. KBS0724 TaxID=1179674 RepID=UPI00110DD6DB|nr:hypothetical protein [Rhodococcus sp. KBS0724]TSD47997.1 hypothetical protein FFI94_018960 [Rhodococcus sp. KBS0724]
MTAFAKDARGVAVLGGMRCTPEAIRRKLSNANERNKGNVISVQAELWLPGDSRDDVVLRASVGLKNGQVMVAMVNSLYTAGFSLTLELSDGANPNHHHVEFGSDVSDEAVERLIGCFGEPEPNPAKGMK